MDVNVIMPELEIHCTPLEEISRVICSPAAILALKLLCLEV